MWREVNQGDPGGYQRLGLRLGVWDGQDGQKPSEFGGYVSRGSLYGLSGHAGRAEVGEQVSGFCRDPLEGRALPVSSITQHHNAGGTNTTYTTHSVASSIRLSVSGSASPNEFWALFPSRGQEGEGNELTLQG